MMMHEEAAEPVWFIRITARGELMSLPRAEAYGGVWMDKAGFLRLPNGEQVALLDSFCYQWFEALGEA